MGSTTHYQSILLSQPIFRDTLSLEYSSKERGRIRSDDKSLNLIKGIVKTIKNCSLPTTIKNNYASVLALLSLSTAVK